MDPFDRLPDEVYQLIFHAVADCKSLVRCMAVCRAFKEHSERVSTLSIVCPGQFTSYVDKLQRIFAMVRRFHSLEVLIVRVGQPKDEPPSWARCMRFAEIGASVEKFIFMAAKTGEFSDFDLALRGLAISRKEKRDSSTEDEADSANEQQRVRRTTTEPAAASGVHKQSRVADEGGASTSGTPRAPTDDHASGPSDQRTFPDFSLRQVVAPSNDVLKRMVPVIVFAIVQGLDEFRDSVPAFIHKFKKLKTFLLVDMLESVTVFMREHQIQQIRTRPQQQRESDWQQDDVAINEDDEFSGREVINADEERMAMSRHDDPGTQEHRSGTLRINEEGAISVRDRRGKAADACEESESGSSNNISSRKGKEVEPSDRGDDWDSPSSSSKQDEPGESSSGIPSGKSEVHDDKDEDEVTSPLREEGGEARRRYVDVVRGSPTSQVDFERDITFRDSSSAEEQAAAENSRAMDQCVPTSSGDEDSRVAERADEKTLSDDGAETWRNCKGICIHGPGDGRGEFVYNKHPFKRILKGNRDSRSMRIGSFRRQENRIYKGLSFRRREESRAFRTWRLGKREREDDGSYTAQSVFENPTPGRGSPIVFGAAEEENSEGGGGQTSATEEAQNTAPSYDPLGDCSVGSSRPMEVQNRHFRYGDGRSEFSSLPSASSASSNGNLEQEQQQQQQQQPQNVSYRGGLEARSVRMSHREAWREAWRETWGERLGRRARELRREMQMQNAAAEVEREGLRRERLREGVRKRQLEIEREALRFDITFWRAEEVVASRSSNYSLTDVSMCIATHAAKPLDACELQSLASSALAGPLLAATIAFVNEQAGFHKL